MLLRLINCKQINANNKKKEIIKMKKNLIAIIALTAALAASTSAFADTVQISEEELNKPVSTYAPDAMPTPEIQGDIMLLNGEETDVSSTC